MQDDAENLKVADALKASWVYYLPESIWPYAQLARWERPIGWWLLLWPCWWSLALGMGSQPSPETDWAAFFFYMVLFLVGAIAMRGAGCTYNDLVDIDLDGQVARTRSRPLPSGRASRNGAIWFIGLQLSIGLIVLLQFNTYTIVTGLISLVTVLIYPFMKRVTWWPQLFLGFAFSWGALMGWPALHGQHTTAPVLLYLGSILWVIGYDTIYAHQDREDDAIVGMGSTARLFDKMTGLAVSLLFAGASILFALAIHFSGIHWIAFAGLAAGAGHMAWQIRNLDIDDGAQCLRLFKSNSQFGWILFAALLLAAVIMRFPAA